MPLIEAALAFAITMLALSLVVSSFVELVHRIFSMRQSGLQYMLGQMFDQVLKRHAVAWLNADVTQKNPGIVDALRDQLVQVLLPSARAAFVARMSANRAPMGVTPKATPTDPDTAVANNRGWAFSLWGGRDLSTLTPAQFMERLGSIDIGAEIQRANTAANAAAAAAGAAAGAATDAVLKDVAQKFQAFGDEAADYFEGRARLLSVVVAVALAFAAHVDAVDLFRTYLRDPNARAKVIEQSQALAAQYKSAQDAAEAVKKLVPDAGAAPKDVKAEVDKLKKDWQAAIGDASATVKQYADLGAPLGWTDGRLGEAKMLPLVWTCTRLEDNVKEKFETLWQTCRSDESDNPAKAADNPAKDEKSQPQAQMAEPEKHFTKYQQIWFEIPTVPRIWFYLFLGGLLIGLGSPFWYDVVTGLTNIRGAASGSPGTAPPSAPPGAAVVPVVAAVANPEAGKAQPATPVGAFQISNAAR
jgi:hypothetical protein